MKIESKVKKDLTITPDSWVLSLVRKDNSEHGFLIVEGIMNYKPIVRRYDLFMGDTQNPNKPAQKTVAIGISERYGEDTVKKYLEEDIFKNDSNKPELYSKSWNITLEKAKELHETVEHDRTRAKNFEISYFQSGGKSIFGWSSQPSENNHNCYSWAAEKVDKLKIKGVAAPKGIADYFIMRPSNHIGPKEKQISFTEIASAQCAAETLGL